MERIACLLTLLLVFTFSFFVAVLPDSENEKSVGKWLFNFGFESLLSVQASRENGKQYFYLTEWLFDRTYLYDGEGNVKKDKIVGFYTRESFFHRNIRLREQVLVANDLKPEVISNLEDIGKQLPEEAVKNVVGLNLRGKDLRYADFSESLMPEVDFRKIDGVATRLDYVIFRRAVLYKAKMNEAQLRGADMSEAQLQDANMIMAQIQGADMPDAQLQGANMRSAQLQGVNMANAQLQGANMESALLQGANMFLAELQGVDMGSAWLQGANMSNAQFQSTELQKSHLAVSSLYHAKFGQLTEQQIQELLEQVTQENIEPEILKKIKKSLFAVKDNATDVSEVEGLTIFIDEADNSLRNALEQNSLNISFEASLTEYQNKLAKILIEQLCRDKWMATGIIKHRINRFYGEKTKNLLPANFAQCLLTLKDKKDPSGRFVCKGLSEISDDDVIERLKLETEEMKSNKQSTFKCPSAS